MKVIKALNHACQNFSLESRDETYDLVTISSIRLIRPGLADTIDNVLIAGFKRSFGKRGWRALMTFIKAKSQSFVNDTMDELMI